MRAWDDRWPRSLAYRVVWYLAGGVIFVVLFWLLTRMTDGESGPWKAIIMGAFWTVFMGLYFEWRYRRRMNQGERAG